MTCLKPTFCDNLSVPSSRIKLGQSLTFCSAQFGCKPSPNFDDLKKCLVGSDSSVGITTRYWLDAPGIEFCFQWPRCLTRRSAVDRLLRLRVRIPPGLWMFVLCVLYNQEKEVQTKKRDRIKQNVGAGDFFLTLADRPWGPPSLLYNRYRVFFPRGQSGRGVVFTNHPQLAPRLKKE